ncbi:hypothetical protein [uncultured Gimesia sp.]|uniref:hypothetical protein n=1 Tax=uncultured Gimesia sp. TaxID=1678688 RepID=UPI0030D83E0E
MKFSLYVTTKGFCKRAWVGAFLAVGTLVMGPLLFLVITRLQGWNFNYVEHDPFSFHFAYLGFSWIVFLGVCLHALTGCQKISLGLPVSSRVIATWMMLATVGLVVVLQLVTNGAYRMLFFDEHWLVDYWPVLGPLLFITTLILVGHSAFWGMHAPSFTKLLFWTGSIVAMFWWFIARYYPNGFTSDVVPWRDVTLSEFVTLQLIGIAAWYQGTRAFGRVRSGTAVPSPQWEQVQTWWAGLITGAIPEKMSIPLSRRMALARLHWRDSCQRAVIVGGILLGAAVLAVNLLSTLQFDIKSPRLGSDIKELAEGFQIGTMLFSFIAAILVAVLLGEGICGQGRTEMKRFLAIAPLSDRDMNVILFWNMIKAFVFTLLMIQVALLLSYATAFFVLGSETLSANLNLRVLAEICLSYSVSTAIGFWVIAANIISVFWTGRTWFFYTMLGSFFGGILLLFGSAGFTQLVFGSYAAQWYFEVTIFLMLSISLIAGTVIAYMAAVRKQLITKTKSWLAFLLWLTLLSGFLIEKHYQPTSSHIGNYFFFTILFTLIVAPFATIPLALSWNRHR